MASDFGHGMSDEQKQMTDRSIMHFCVTARPCRDGGLETVVAVIEPELNSHISSKFRNKCWAKFRQLAKFRHSKLYQTPKNHPFRIGPPNAT